MTKLKLIIPKQIQGTRSRITVDNKCNIDDAALLPIESEVSGKEPGSVTPTTITKTEVSTTKKTTTTRTVRFAPKKSNTYYLNPFALDETELARRWYSKLEIDAFFHEMAAVMKDIQSRAREAGPFHWTKALVHIHRSFSAPVASRRALLTLMEGRFEIDDGCLGLEVRGIPELNEAFRVQRRELLRRIRYWQEHGSRKLTEEQVADLIHEASTQSSKSSTDYAHYVAQYHARRIKQEHRG